MSCSGTALAGPARSQRQPTRICISGEPGAGKSSVARWLCRALGADFVSAGDAQRKLAEARGLTTLQLNELSEKDATIDESLDATIAQLTRSDGRQVIDSRIGWLVLPDSLKVRLVCSARTAAARIFADRKRSAEHYKSPDDALAQLRRRRDSERNRFRARYGVDISDPKHYDMLVRTDGLSIDEVGRAILDHMIDGLQKPRLVANPAFVLPTPPADALDAAAPTPIGVVIVGDAWFAVSGHCELLDARRRRRSTVCASLVGWEDAASAAPLPELPAR